MEFLILVGMIFGYSSLSSKISWIMNHMPSNVKKKLPSLKELIGKKILLETDDYLEYTYECKTKGILREYNDTWIVIEVVDKNNQRELYYYRLSHITGIRILEQ